MYWMKPNLESRRRRRTLQQLLWNLSTIYRTHKMLYCSTNLLIFFFFKFFSMDKTQHCYLCYTKALNFLGDENRPEMDRWVKGHSCLVDNWWDMHAVVRYVPGKQVSAPLINTISSAAACNGVRFSKPLDFQKNWLSSAVTWCSGIPVTCPPPPPCTL